MTKQDFLGKIEKNIYVNVIAQLREQTLPLILWGCGDVADAAWDYLQQNDIIVHGIWMDNVGKGVLYKNMPVETLDDIHSKCSEINVILGHSQYDLGIFLKEKYPFIKNVFYLASVHYGQYENVPYEKVEEVADRMVSLISNLGDQKSIDCLLAYLNTKITGNQQYIFDVHDKNSNFYCNDIFHVTGEETLLDIGAYNGDTLKLFLQETNNQYRKVIALEPDDKSFLELNDYIAQMRLKNVVTSKLGAWNERKDLKFVTGNEQISSVSLEPSQNNTITIYADRIDNIFMEDVSLIKINYFSGVLEAIQGCENIIKKHHSKLAIDVGFDIYNVLKLSEYILSLNEGYQIFLRFNRAMSSTFTLYAITNDK